MMREDYELASGKPISELYEEVTRAAILGLGVNLLLGVIKLAGGIIGNSFALIADAVNSIGDVVWVRKSGLEFFADIHIEVDQHLSVAEGHQIGHQAKDRLLKVFPNLRDVLVHLEPFARRSHALREVGLIGPTLCAWCFVAGHCRVPPRNPTDARSFFVCGSIAIQDFSILN